MASDKNEDRDKRDRKEEDRSTFYTVLRKHWRLFITVMLIFLIAWTAAFASAYDYERLARDAAAEKTVFRANAVIGVALTFMRDYAIHTFPVMMALGIALALSLDGKEHALMVITRWIEKKADEEQYNLGKADGRAEGVGIGRAEGRAEAGMEWKAYYERMKKAQENGEPFDEDPPA